MNTNKDILLHDTLQVNSEQTEHSLFARSLSASSLSGVDDKPLQIAAVGHSDTINALLFTIKRHPFPVNIRRFSSPYDVCRILSTPSDSQGILVMEEAQLRAENGRLLDILQAQSLWKCLIVSTRNEIKETILLCSPDKLLQTIDHLIRNICYNISRSPLPKAIRPKVGLSIQPEEYTLSREELTVLLQENK